MKRIGKHITPTRTNKTQALYIHKEDYLNKITRGRGKWETPEETNQHKKLHKLCPNSGAASSEGRI